MLDVLETTYAPSPQQANFIDWAQNGRGSCVLIAVAGAGKTTTAVEAVKVMPGQTLMLAYGKKNADDLKAKLEGSGLDWRKAQAGTVHSLGLKALRKQFPDMVLSEYKVADLVALMCEQGEIDSKTALFQSAICGLVSMAKQRAIGIYGKIQDDSLWFDIIEHYDMLDEEGEQARAGQIVKAAQKALVRSNNHVVSYDFDDMIYLPLIHKVKFWQFDNIIMDEAQDSNNARRALVRAMLKRGGRAIFIGDDRQAILGFTGADNDSLDVCQEEFNCIRMPLTVTYRCPKVVVQFARQWVGHIEAHESAPDGVISEATFSDLLRRRSELNASAVILCRNTAPLVSAAFSLIRNRIACRIEGREIGTGLVKLASRWKSVRSINELENKLADYAERQITSLKAKRKDVQAQQIEDKVATLNVVMDRCREEGKSRVDDVVAYLNTLFSDNVAGLLTLSTIHKSKGREWQTVFWLNRAETCPSRYARQAWTILQEENLMYVAATRAQHELVELRIPMVRDKDKVAETVAEAVA